MISKYKLIIYALRYYNFISRERFESGSTMPCIAIDRLEKNPRMRMKVQGSLIQARFIEIHQVFTRTNKVWYFSNRVCMYVFMYILSRPRWSRGNFLSSRCKVRGFTPGWGRWIFSERKNPEKKSSERDFKLGVPSLRLLSR